MIFFYSSPCLPHAHFVRLLILAVVICHCFHCNLHSSPPSPSSPPVLSPSSQLPDRPASDSPCGNSKPLISLKLGHSKTAKAFVSQAQLLEKPGVCASDKTRFRELSIPLNSCACFSCSFQRLWGHSGQECAVATAAASDKLGLLFYCNF